MKQSLIDGLTTDNSFLTEENEFLKESLAETVKTHTQLAVKLTLAIEELKQCKIDLFEAEDKFHVLSFYISDEQSLRCAKSRVKWMYEAGNRVKETLKELEK